MAAAAERALQRYGARSLQHFSTLLDTANACGRALLQLVQRRDATVRMRVLGFLVAAAAGSAEAALLLKQSGGISCCCAGSLWPAAGMCSLSVCSETPSMVLL